MRTHLYILGFMLSAYVTYAQNTVNGKNVGKYLGGTETTDFSSRAYFNKTELLGKASINNKIEGSALLFEGWDNKGIIVLGDKNYLLNNLNYDIDQDAFLSKINKDSTFVFDFANIDKIVINDKQFKTFYNSVQQKNKIYEVIYENDNFSLLKNYFVVVTKGSPDPMLNRPNDKIKKESAYYILQNNVIEPFKWNKKSIVSLIDEDKKEEFEKYVKKNKLSYKDESDVRKMLKIFLKI
jgi:hypothetical protein